eukprot:29736_1
MVVELHMIQIINNGNPLKPLIFKTGNGMPPIDINTPVNWLINYNNNNNNVIELILTCSNDKSLTPTYDPTTDPTTGEPTPRSTSHQLQVYLDLVNVLDIS